METNLSNFPKIDLRFKEDYVRSEMLRRVKTWKRNFEKELEQLQQKGFEQTAQNFRDDVLVIPIDEILGEKLQ